MKVQNLIRGLVLGAALTAISAAAVADTVRIRFHTYYGTEMDPIGKRMQEAVKEKSGGDIRMQYFRGGQLVDSDQFVDAVARGTIDIAYGVGSYWPGQIDLANIEAGLPGAWTDVEEARDVFNELNPLLEQAYAEKGVTLIGRGFGSNYDLLTKNPVRSLEDLKGMKIRATGQMAKVLGKFDVRTVFLPAQELYIAMSTGVIDGVLYGGPVEYEQLKFGEVAKYYTELNLLNPGWTDTIIANTKVWDQLTEEQRNIIQEAVRTYAAEIHAWLEEGNARVKKESKEFEFASLPAEDSAKLSQSALEIWKEEATKSERARQAVDILAANAKKQGR